MLHIRRARVTTALTETIALITLTNTCCSLCFCLVLNLILWLCLKSHTTTGHYSYYISFLTHYYKVKIYLHKIEPWL